MNNLKHLLKKPLGIVPNSLVIFILVIALLGFADSSYLTIEHFRGIIPPCSLAGDCGAVLQSSYSVIFGLPVSLLGSVYYLIVSVGVFSYLDTKKTAILKWILLFTIFGLLASIWFVFLQAFVIKSYCLYCLGSALTSTILFITTIVVFAKYFPFPLPELNALDFDSGLNK